MCLNFTYQQVQAALAGQVPGLARLPLVADFLHRGDLVEAFGAAGRTDGRGAYWLVVLPQASERPEVLRFREWLLSQAKVTRKLIGERSSTRA